MARRLQITGFARFLMLMVVLAPLAYIGASYYNGQDGIANFKKLIGIGEQKTATVNRSTSDKVSSDEKTIGVDAARLQEKIKSLEAENESLLKQLDEKEQEIRQLKIKVDRLQQ